MSKIQQQEEFSTIAPDLAIELPSSSDSLSKLQGKMQEYIDNGVSLGWSIDTTNRQVEIYRPNKSVETLISPTSLSGEEVLPGFVLNLNKIW